MSSEEEVNGEQGGLIVESSPEGKIVLRLFVAGSTQKSTKAITNLRSILEENVHGKYDLEVIDLYQQPELAKKYGLLAAPTVLKTEPLPVRRIIGDMSDEARVLGALEIIKREL